jgi:hypothetical protein
LILTFAEAEHPYPERLRNFQSLAADRAGRRSVSFTGG